MNALNAEQLDRIRADIARAHIDLHNLQEELMDHLCCEAEHLMEQGKSFDEAYQIIRQYASIKYLQDIQESTLLLTNKPFAIMKTTMKFSGLFALTLISVGTLLRFTHLPGANILMVSGFILLTFLFVPAAVFLDYSTSVHKQWFKRITLLLGCLSVCNGILFKVMHWTGASALILSGFVILLGIFLPQVLAKQVRESESRTEKFLFGLGIVSVGIFVLGFLFKLMHWPGAAVLFVTGIVLLGGIFFPLYSMQVLLKKERSIATLIFWVILTIYTVTLTGLISISPVNETLQRQITIEQPQ